MLLLRWRRWLRLLHGLLARGCGLRLLCVCVRGRFRRRWGLDWIPVRDVPSWLTSTLFYGFESSSLASRPACIALAVAHAQEHPFPLSLVLFLRIDPLFPARPLDTFLSDTVTLFLRARMHCQKKLGCSLTIHGRVRQTDDDVEAGVRRGCLLPW